MGTTVGFVCGLSDKKLSQFLEPIQYLEEVEQIRLFRRTPYQGKKVVWAKLPRCLRQIGPLLELARIWSLIWQTKDCDVLIGCAQRFHGVWAAIAGRVFNKPVIQLIITDVDWIWSKPLYRYAVSSSQACGVMGERSKAQLAKQFDGEIQAIYLPEFSARPQYSNDIPREPRYDLLVVANNAKAKDFPWMLRLVAKLKSSRTDVSLAIAGLGHESLQTSITALDLTDNVKLLGSLDENGLHEVYGTSRLLLLTSYREGLPMVALEAMAHGLPIFATQVGDLPWLIRENVEGRLVQHGDTIEFARKLNEALEDPQSLARMGRAAYERFVTLSTEFEVPAIAGRWRSLFASLDEKATPPANARN